jgi:hypothetical protein
MEDYDEELSEIESEVGQFTRQVSGYDRVGFNLYSVHFCTSL